jgi:AraC-like DNA-binding protein
MLAAPHEEIEAEAELAIVENLVRELGDVPGLGVLAGRAYRLATYGIWGYALISSPTPRKAVELGLRYLDLTFAFTRIRFEEAEGEGRLLVECAGIAPSIEAFLVERDLTAALTAFREVANPAPSLLGVSFAHAAPRDLGPYLETFGIEPRFGAGANVFSFPAFVLDRAMPETDPQTALACERECRALLARRRARGGFAERVRDELLARPRNADIDSIAQRFHVTARTLRRRLEAEGTSFRDLKNEMRHVLAEELLSTGALSIGDIADRLGYSDASNFVHAFRRWNGVTPAAFSARLARGPVSRRPAEVS